MKRILPNECPSCESKLSVKSLHCDRCQTSVEGKFELPILTALTSDEQEFILSFVKSSGSLKQMATERGISYPTIRNYLDEVIARVKRLQEGR